MNESEEMIDPERIQRFREKLQAKVDKEFGTTDDGTPLVEIMLFDRGRGWMPFRPIPHMVTNPEKTTPEQLQEWLFLAGLNDSYVREQFRLFNYELSTYLKRLIVDQGAKKS